MNHAAQSIQTIRFLRSTKDLFGFTSLYTHEVFQISTC